MAVVLKSIFVDDQQIKLQFNPTVKLSSITNDSFLLYSDLATPVVTPFQTIDVANDFNSITRTLILWYKAPLLAATNYKLTVFGLQDVAGNTLDPAAYSFVTDTLSATTPPRVPLDEPVEIIDKSIRSKGFINSARIIASNPDFFVLESTPGDQEILVPPSYNNGRITIKFSTRPNDRFISSRYFRAQAKLLTRAPTRWVDVPALVSVDSSQPWVYLDFPSTDATPVYNITGASYFLENYKYRIKISKDVGT